jgi:hypothetical protein
MSRDRLTAVADDAPSIWMGAIRPVNEDLVCGVLSK